MSDPTSAGLPYLTLCTPWTTVAAVRGDDGCEPCRHVTALTPDDAVIEAAILGASEYLHANSMYQFTGTCESVARPCGSEDQQMSGIWGWSEIPFFFPAGVFPAWWGWGGCGSGCNCCGPPAFALGRIPVVAVSEVKLDGEVLVEGTDYELVDNLLARLIDGESGGRWPTCQNIALPDTEVGTFSVTFTWGAAVPELGAIAARDLACQLIGDACGADCKPSERMVSRQAGGTTVQLISPDGDVRTSLPRSAKLFLEAYGPPSPSMRQPAKLRRPNSGQGFIFNYPTGAYGYNRGGFGSGCQGC